MVAPKTSENFAVAGKVKVKLPSMNKVEVGPEILSSVIPLEAKL